MPSPRLVRTKALASVRSTYAAELLSLLDAVGQGNMVATAMDEIHSGVETATQLLARHTGRQRPIEHDACVDAKAVFDGITAQCPRTPADKPLFLHALNVGVSGSWMGRSLVVVGHTGDARGWHDQR